MTVPLLPLDASGHPIDVLHLMPGTAQQIVVTATSARNATPFGAATAAIAVYTTQSCFIRTGNNTVTAAATDHFLPAGFYTTLALKGDTYLAAISGGTNGTLYVSELA